MKMDFQVNNINRRFLKHRLYQMGTTSDVFVRLPASKDKLNNDVKEFHKIGETIIYAHWSGATDEERNLSSGEFNKVTPTFIFPHDSIVEDDCHVFFNGNEYETTAVTSRGNHFNADGKEISVLTDPKGHNFVKAFDENGDEIELPIEL